MTLQQQLAAWLPYYTRNPFSPDAKLWAPDLAEPLGMSRHGVAKWFREGKLTADGAKKLCALANAPLNMAALERLDAAPPKIEDFAQFVLA